MKEKYLRLTKYFPNTTWHSRQKLRHALKGSCSACLTHEAETFSWTCNFCRKLLNLIKSDD